MKKVFTALFALLGFAMYMNAATVDELKPLEQSYVCVLGDYVDDGNGSRTAEGLFGDDYFLELSLNGGSIAINKGSIDIADVSTYVAVNGADVETLAAKYSTYGSRLNCVRLKNAQDKIAFKPIAGSKVYVFGNGNGKTGEGARIPKFAKDAALEEALNEAPGADHPATGNYVYEFTVPEGFDGTVPMYLGSYNGDAFFSFIVVEVPVVAPKVAYLNDAPTETEAIYTALVNAGMEVTPLNWAATTLTEEIVANDLVGKYDLVVLAGGTGSGTNLAKTANLLVGKVNVLSTKSFWYKHYGTNGGNPGTAETPSLSLVKTVAGHPIFAGIEGDEFAVFNDMGKASGRYLQSNGSFNETVGLTQTTLATTNGADCIGEGWLNGCGYVIIPVDGLQPEGYLTAAGQTLFANAAQYLVDGVPYVALDLTAYNEAVAAAEAFKATLQSEDALKVLDAETLQMCVEEIDLAIAYAQEGVDAATSQEDVDISTNMLNETVMMYKGNYDRQVMLAEAQRLTYVGDSIYNMYPEETRVDNAGLLDAMQSLPFGRFWGTAEEGMALCKACEEAIVAFQKENNQLILDAAKKKANDYAATLDASEETGTMVQMDAYNTLTYMTSDDFFAGDGKDITADNYEMVMSYSQQIDMLIAQYDPVIQKEKSMMAATKAAAAAQETMASYDNATDEAGLADAIAKVNEILGELNMWDTMYTLEDLNAAVDALAAARVAFEKENGLDTGTYWLKNVASGKFITAGEHWGTCAVFGEHGLDFELALQEDGTYTIDSKLSNGGESHYFGAEGWMDAAVTKWNIVRMPGGAYSISADGTNFLGYDEANVWNAQTKVSVNMTDNTAEAAQWIIMSKDKMIASLEGASVANPADATFFISCANFGRNDTRFASAWQGGPARGGNYDNMAGEKWNTNFDVYQDLAGLPNGYYKLSAQGYYRAGNGGATGMERNAYLYAGANKTPLVNINTEAGNSVFEGGNVSTVEGKGIVPNNMATACTGFTAGLYADNSVIVEVTDGTLRIGVKKDVLIGADWTMFDNFELTYYGTELPPVVADGTYYMKNVASGKFLNGGNSWGTQASLVDNGFDATLTYSNGTYTIDTNVPNGGNRHFLGSNGYVDSDVANWKVVPVGENYAITLDGVNYIGYNGENSVMALNLTDAANTAAQWQFITKEEMVAALDGATEANPGNATFFIVGQNFNRGDANRNAAWQGSPVINGENNINFAAEKFNTNFDVYQELTGLPAGYYELSAQAYYRAGGNDVLVANKDSKNAVLYAGINSVPVMSILENAGMEGVDGATNIEGYGNVPNNMAEAGKTFAKGLYANNKVVALVTDGTLRVGIKKEETIANDWTMFDNFQLAYLGTAVPSVFADAVDSLNAAIADANAWKATLDATNEMDAQVIAQIEQGMLPAAQAVAAQPASIAQIEQMIADVNMFVAQTSMTLGQMKAAEAQALLAEYDDPEYYTEEFTAAFNEVFNIANGLATGAYTWADLDAALTKMNEAKETFVIQNVPAPAVNVIGAINGHRLVELTSDHVVETKIFYSYDEAMTEPAIYTAPIMVSETATVYAYAMFIDEATRERYISQKVAFEVAAGDEIVLNEPVIEETEEGLVITSDQSDVTGEPEVSIEYAFYPMTDIQTGELASTASESGAYTEALAGLGYGQLIAKAVAFGYTTSVAIYNIEPAKVAYLCGATETTEAIYTALVNGGDMRVVPMNYDDVTLTEETANELAANYDLVVLAGNTGSGTNLAKSANLLVGKVNVLSTKSFWYKHYGTNGSNPGTADTPSRSLTKTVADHPIFEGIEGDEFEVFNDMAKETGRYLQGNGSFNDAVGLTQTALAQTNGTDCIGEGWLNGFGYVIVPVDGVQPAGWLTADGEALFVNIANYLIAGEQYAGSGSVTDNPFGIDVTTTEEIQWPADIYDIKGRMVKKEATSLEGLQSGLYLIKGQKVLVK